MTIDGRERLLVDGGVVSNQPLSNLAENGCGTIFACAVGPTGVLPPPANGVDNAFRTVGLMMHQCTKLEEDYVRLKLGEGGAVHHIHPEMAFPVHEFDFTPELVQQVMDEACTKTLEWLSHLPPD
jgi:predicted acylesterase/phospholipase RssA